MKLPEVGDKVKVTLSVGGSPDAKHLKDKEGIVEEKAGYYRIVRIGKRTAFIHQLDLLILK